MKLKQGISLNGVQAEIVLAIVIVGEIYKRHGSELVVTSLTDGIAWRKPGSLHLSGCAFDCRIWDFQGDALDALVKDIQAGLTDEFDVVLEDDHIHIELDPD